MGVGVGPVRQVSDEAKAAVPAEVTARARAMGREALAQRLKEIALTPEEDATYRPRPGDGDLFPSK